MSSWTVYKAGRYAWTAHRKGKLPDKLFRTWREAQDYADRMTRTRINARLQRTWGWGE